MSGTVHPLPDREAMPPEFAALGLPGEDGQLRIIINSSEARPVDLLRWLIRPHAILAVLFAPIVKWSRDHPLPALGGAVVAGAAAGTVFVAPLTDIRLDRPGPPAVERVVTMTATPVVSSIPPRTSPTPAPTKSWRSPPPTQPPANGEEAQPPRRRPTREPAPAPTPTRTTKKPTSKASTHPPVERSASPPPSSSEPPSSTPTSDAGRTQATTTPPATPSPQQEDPPPTTTGDRDCLVGVDLDPLLNLCVLP